eukprot:1359674-Prymnesium_polylepis.1
MQPAGLGGSKTLTPRPEGVSTAVGFDHTQHYARGEREQRTAQRPLCSRLAAAGERPQHIERPVGERRRV